MKISVGKIVFGVFAVLFFSVAWPDPLKLPFVLLFGWISAGARLGSALMRSGLNLALPLLGLIVLAWGGHRFLSWAHSRNATADCVPATSPWRWQWSLGLIGGLWLVLFAVMSFLGVAHQVGWILVSKEPIYVPILRYSRDRSVFMNATVEFERTARSNAWDLATARAKIWNEHPFGSDHPFWEKFSIRLISETNGAPTAALIFPRDSKLQEHIGYAVVRSGEGTEFKRGDVTKEVSGGMAQPMTVSKK